MYPAPRQLAPAWLERVRRGLARAALLALLSPPTAGCQSDARRAEQGRTALLAERIARVRRAHNRDKRPLLLELKATECVGPEACGLKDLCVQAYELHQQALDELAALSRVAARDAAPGPDVGPRLRRTEQDLSRARQLGERCAEEQVRTLRRVIL